MAYSDAVPILTLLWTVFESILEVFILCFAGYVLARVGICDKATQRKLNVINVSLLTPALLTSKVAFNLTPAKLAEMWIIPIGFVLVTGVSALIAWGLAKVLGLKRSQRAFAMCAAMFQNSNSLPIALIQSLVVEVPGLKWGDDDTKDEQLARALIYMTLYSTLGMMLRWSWGVSLLSKADEDVPAAAEVVTNENGNGNGHGGVLTTEPGGLDLASPEAITEGTLETDPLFSSIDRSDTEASTTTTAAERRDSQDSDTAPSFQWTSGPGSAHSMHITNSNPVGRTTSGGTAIGSTPVNNSLLSSTPRGISQLSSSPGQQGGSGFTIRSPGNSGVMTRKMSSYSASGRRKPTRTESGRDFLGLPEARKSKVSLSDQEEDEDEEEIEEGSDEEWGDEVLPSGISRRRRQFASPPHSRFAAFLRRTKNKVKSIAVAINGFLTVPMYAALLSIFIAMIPPLQHTLAKSKPLTEAIKGAGQCSIPLTLLVLGAFFYTPPSATPPAAAAQPSPTSSEGRKSFFERKIAALRNPSPGSEANPGENATVIVAVLSRMVLAPLLLLPLVALVARFDLFEAAEDPVFILAATLLISSPPAVTIAQLTSAASGDAFEKLVSKTIFWSYAVLTGPFTLLYVVLGLIFGRL